VLVHWNVPDSIDYSCLVTEPTPTPRLYGLPPHESQNNAGFDRQESPPMTEYTDKDRDTVRTNSFNRYIQYIYTVYIYWSEGISVLVWCHNVMYWCHTTLSYHIYTYLKPVEFIILIHCASSDAGHSEPCVQRCGCLHGDSSCCPFNWGQGWKKQEA